MRLGARLAKRWRLPAAKEQVAADATRNLLRSRGITGISIFFTP